MEESGGKWGMEGDFGGAFVMSCQTTYPQTIYPKPYILIWGVLYTKIEGLSTLNPRSKTWEK